MTRGADLSPNLPKLNSDEFAWSLMAESIYRREPWVQ